MQVRVQVDGHRSTVYITLLLPVDSDFTSQELPSY